jgi:hypothetical protein
MKNVFRGIPVGEFEGVKHNALADAVYQAAYLRKILHFVELNNAH